MGVKTNYLGLARNIETDKYFLVTKDNQEFWRNYFNKVTTDKYIVVVFISLKDISSNRDVYSFLKFALQKAVCNYLTGEMNKQNLLDFARGLETGVDAYLVFNPLIKKVEYDK